MASWRAIGGVAALLFAFHLAEPAHAQTVVTSTAGGLTTIRIDNIGYHNARDALDALRLNLASKVNALHPEKEPVAGKLRIVLPDRDRLRPLVAQKVIFRSRDGANSQPVRNAFTGEMLAFYADVERLMLHAMADALVKTGAFQSVKLVEQNDTRDPDIGDADYLAWYQVRSLGANNTGLWIGTWLVRRSGDDSVLGAAIDPGVPAGTPRYASFVKAVRDAATTLGNGSTSGAQPVVNGGRRMIGTGSGIVVDAGGAIITNNHVVRSCGEIRVVDATGHRETATLAAHDATNDLALLKTTQHWSGAASLRDMHGLRPGDDVVVAGYPLSNLLGSDMAVTTGSLTMLSGLHDDSRLLQLSAPVQPGNSGGPLLDRNGNVVGVVTSTLNGAFLAVSTGALPQNVNFAIKSSVVASFLEANHVAYATGEPSVPLSPADVGDIARRFTMRVECLR